MSYKNKSYKDAMQIDQIFPIIPPNNQKSLDPKKTIDKFLSDYYKTITIIGWNHLSGLYNPNTMIIIKNHMVGNHHDFVSYLSQNYIKRANYGDLSSKWVVTDPKTVILNIFGSMQFIDFFGQTSATLKFTETFILTIATDDNIKINTQMLDF